MTDHEMPDREDVPEEIRILRDADRLVGDDVPTELVARGWEPRDLDVPDHASGEWSSVEWCSVEWFSVEWYWPPTAPLGYGGRVEQPHPLAEKRPLAHPARRTPWLCPTRITRSGSGWLLEYGSTSHHLPGEPVHIDDDAELIRDLPRIEWWPMSPKEARRLQINRVYSTTLADARNDFSQGYGMSTEPYESRLAQVAHLAHGGAPRSRREAWLREGDLAALRRLIDAEAWAASVRSDRAGGTGWAADGPSASEDGR